MMSKSSDGRQVNIVLFLKFKKLFELATTFVMLASIRRGHSFQFPRVQYERYGFGTRISRSYQPMVASRCPCRMASSGSVLSSSESVTVADSESVATKQMKHEAKEQLKILQTHYNTILRKQQQSSPSSPPTINVPEFWTDDTDTDINGVTNYIEQNIDNILFDCDGVLYRTLDVCPGASYCISRLMEMGKTVLFVTNNAGVNRRELRVKLNKLLFNSSEVDASLAPLSDEQMISSSYSSAQYLEQHLPNGGRVHVIGSSGLMEEITNHGFICSGGPGSSSSPSSMTRQELADYDFPENPIDAVVVGHDTSFDFRKLSIANNLLLQNPEALFVATNEDSFDLVGDNGDRHIPGNGCVVKALEHCSRRKAINVGKPSQYLAQLIFSGTDDSSTVSNNDDSGSKPRMMTLDPSRSLFVGDRLDTDIRFGNENGMKSLLVLTGVTTAKTMIDLGEGTEEEPLPHFIAPYIGLLVK